MTGTAISSNPSRTTVFDEAHILHELHHYLPSQSPLKDFIHHNSLHAFQQKKFYDAIQQSAKIFGFHVTLELREFRTLYHNGRIREDILDRVLKNKKGEAASEWKKKLLEGNYNTEVHAQIGAVRAAWKNIYGIDLDGMVQPVLFRILCAYLDQGIATDMFPLHPGGLLASLRALEKNSMTSFFRTSAAKKLLHDESQTLSSLLGQIVGDEKWFDAYLFDQQFTHRGWSGMVCSLETRPEGVLDKRNISLRDLIHIELILEIDALQNSPGSKRKKLSAHLTGNPPEYFAETAVSETDEIFRLWQDAFEWSYYDEVLSGMRAAKQGPQTETKQKSFQAIFCIDERECSLRRHIEAVDADCETLGSPGFFGVEFYFQPEHGKFYEKLCPAPVTPKYLIKEVDTGHERGHELLYAKPNNRFLPGILVTAALGFWAAIKLLLLQFRPKMSPAISDAFAHMHPHGKLIIENKNPADRENDLQVGFTIDEMTTRVEGLLRSIGLVDHFAPIVYVMAHGSSSANNPHHGAHDCGACSGRPGSVNARVFAFMANHEAVREKLRAKGIDIPAATKFVGSMHDTASDQIAFYDADILNGSLAENHKRNVAAFDKALDQNAKERSRRFASIGTRMPIKKIREAIRLRSVSMFEPRPELGHGTNTLCIVGRRDMTRKLFLDRRAFLNSYDYRIDPEGKLLQGVMRPLGPVCGGINLEYYFSRIDNYKLGAGTKLPHNVMGLIGVANSCDGDLRPGLPVQMIEVHDPVRLLIIVEHFPEVVLNTIRSQDDMYEWYINEWVHLVAVHPENNKFYEFRDGAFTEYVPAAEKTGTLNNPLQFFETASEMKSSAIEDATKENLPVYLVQ